METDPPARLHLFELAGKTRALLTVHHLVFDGISTRLFFRTLWRAYDAYHRGDEPESVVNRANYRDFVIWEREMLTGPEGRDHLEYWKKQLVGDLPVLPLLAGRTRPAKPSHVGKTHQTFFSSDLSQKIKNWATDRKLNPSTLFLGIFNILLHRYTGERDLIIGMPTMGRPDPRFDEVLGHFVNMIPIRSHVSGEINIVDFLKSLQIKIMNGLLHAAYPFPRLVQVLGLSSRDGVSPVFQSTFTYQNFAGPDLKGIGTGFELVDGIFQEGDHDLGLEVLEIGDCFHLRINYKADLIETSTVQNLTAHFHKLAEAIPDRSERTIARIDMLGDEERQRLLAGVNGGGQTTVDTRPIHRHFETQARKTPDAAALVFTGAPGSTITYRALNAFANRLAAYLIRRGVRPGTFVGMCLGRSPEIVAAQLAIYKTGGVYAPLDPDLPEKHLAFMLDDAGIDTVLLHDPTEQKIKSQVRTIINLDRDQDVISRARKTNPAIPLRKLDLAYVIYTSGSTGDPKGVVVTHQTFSGHCQVIREYLGLTAIDRVMQFAGIAADISLEQKWPCLTLGAAVILRGLEIWPPREFVRVVARNRVTMADIPPGYLHEILLDQQKQSVPPLKDCLRLIIVGGESLPVETVVLWRQSPLSTRTLLNAYGPTEATITSMGFLHNRLCPARGLGHADAHWPTFPRGKSLHPRSPR